MSIVRASRPDTGYLIVSNDVLRDTRLSFRARGVLLSILSRPDNWATSAERIAQESPGEGRGAILTAFRELREAGYMRVVRSRNDLGQITTTTYVYDTPKADEPKSDNRTSAPTRGNTASPLVAPKATQPKSAEGTPIRSTEEEELQEQPKNVPAVAATRREDVEHLCVLLADHIEANLADETGRSRRPTITEEWRNQARLLLDRDGYTYEQAVWLINWCQRDPFWHRNILSMPKFRQQFDRLKLAAKAPATSRRQQETDGLFERATARAIAADRQAGVA